jgi:hypothetical protein
VTVARSPHPEKQKSGTTAIPGGREIDSREEQSQNADSPIIESLLPLSNVTLESLLQREKQRLEMLTIEEGMQIDFSDGTESGH